VIEHCIRKKTHWLVIYATSAGTIFRRVYNKREKKDLLQYLQDMGFEPRVKAITEYVEAPNRTKKAA